MQPLQPQILQPHFLPSFSGSVHLQEGNTNTKLQARRHHKHEADLYHLPDTGSPGSNCVCVRVQVRTRSCGMCLCARARMATSSGGFLTELCGLPDKVLLEESERSEISQSGPEHWFQSSVYHKKKAQEQ